MPNSKLPDYRENSLRIGIIGCGAIARFHADAIKALGLEIQCAADVVESEPVKAFCAKYGVKKFYLDWREMMAKEKLDALWVTASWNVVDQLLMPVLACKVPVFFEKPVSLSAERIQEAIAGHPAMVNKVQVGYNRRFYDFVPQIKDILSQANIKSIEVHIPESTSGIKDPHLLNHLFLQNSSHVADLLFYLLDTADIKVQKIIRHRDPNDGRLKGYNGLLLTDEGVPVHLMANWNSPVNFGLKFHLDDTLVELLPVETATIYQGFEVIEPTEQNPIRRYKPKIKEQFFIDEVSAKFKPGFLKQAINFVDTCVLNKYPNKQAADLRSALAITKFCWQIMRDQKETA
jgi:predicted dehydrogenase